MTVGARRAAIVPAHDARAAPPRISGKGGLGAAAVGLATLACLLPFLGKAFHLDDPLFLWVAQRIREAPLDFYGFTVNWSGTPEPMADVTKNPPGAAFLLAAATAVVGWGERGLHAAFLLPALVAVVGTWAIARRFTHRPVLAAMAALLTPAFLVSATSVMSDVPMLALWITALLLWLEGLERRGVWLLLAAVLLLAGCALTKYFGVALLPLMLLATVGRDRWVRPSLLLLVPVAVWTAYHFGSQSLYGRGLFTEAVAYATDRSLGGGAAFPLTRAVTGLAFAGGGAATVLLLAPLAWSWRTLATAAVATTLGVLGLSRAGLVGCESLAQSSAMVLGGVLLLGLVVVDLRRERNRDSLLLAAWVIGTFAFAAFVNWTVNVRSLLPLVPAAGILLARRLDRRPPVRESLVPVALGLAALLSLAVARADYLWAGSAREAARLLVPDPSRAPSGPRTWFTGHWGFQYYAQALGALPLDLARPAMRPGETLLVPSNNSGAASPAEGAAELVDRREIAGPRFLATMCVPLGAGFYADAWGALPFAFGDVPAETYGVFRAR